MANNLFTFKKDHLFTFNSTVSYGDIIAYIPYAINL